MGISSSERMSGQQAVQAALCQDIGPWPCLGEAWNPSVSGLEQTSSFPLLSSTLPFC